MLRNFNYAKKAALIECNPSKNMFEVLWVLRVAWAL